MRIPLTLYFGVSWHIAVEKIETEWDKKYKIYWISCVFFFYTYSISINGIYLNMETSQKYYRILFLSILCVHNDCCLFSLFLLVATDKVMTYSFHLSIETEYPKYSFSSKYRTLLKFLLHAVPTQDAESGSFVLIPFFSTRFNSVSRQCVCNFMCHIFWAILN